jgi:osmotically inducible protein OsmC
MSIVKTGSANYKSLGQKGEANVSTETSALNEHPYGFTSRFEGGKGTNPEELLAAAHAACFTMALSFALEAEGYKDGNLHTDVSIYLDEDGDGFKISRSKLSLTANVHAIDEKEFDRIAQDTKMGCPVSKLFNADIELEYTLNAA